MYASSPTEVLALCHHLSSHQQPHADTSDLLRHNTTNNGVFNRVAAIWILQVTFLTQVLPKRVIHLMGFHPCDASVLRVRFEMFGAVFTDSNAYSWVVLVQRDKQMVCVILYNI